MFGSKMLKILVFRVYRLVIADLPFFCARILSVNEGWLRRASLKLSHTTFFFDARLASEVGFRQG